jgi:3-hydroxy-9,10-secoandrosta-1,3,5(10)-triene-9,17-dione monooxygenase reductase component
MEVDRINLSQNAFSPRELRNALGMFATGVAVVTSEVRGLQLGTTVSSFNSVSLAPPLVLFSLAHTALSLDLWRQVKVFGVTVLRETQSEISARFSRAASDKWADVKMTRGESGVPLLSGGIATFECEIYAIHDGGDHDIVVGKVLAFSKRDGAPLLFHAGRYRRIQSEAQVESPPDADVWM